MPRGPTGRSLDHVGAALKAQGAVVTAYSANKTVLRMPGEATTTAPRQSSSVLISPLSDVCAARAIAGDRELEP